jgi:hypothetical protein
MKNKYEVAPGLYIGSEMGDLNRELKTEMKKLFSGDNAAKERIYSIAEKRRELLTPKLLIKSKRDK